MRKRRSIVAAAAGLALLAGCATMGGRQQAEGPSTEELLATLSPEQRAPITQAENAVREAERQVSRAEEAVRMAEQRHQAARADVQAREAAIEKAEAQVELVRSQTRAQLEGAPVGGQAPADAEAARRQLDEAQHAVEVAEWERDRAQALERLRQAELAYAEAFRDAAREQVEVRKQEVALAEAQVASQARPNAVPGVVDPSVADAQARVRDRQAEFARARAAATQRLSDVQVQRSGMSRFQAGPPPRLSGAQAGQQPAATRGLAAQPREVEAEPLPWPSAWQPQQGTGQSGGQPGSRTAPQGGGTTGSPTQQ